MRLRVFLVSSAIGLLFTGSLLAQTLGAVLTGSQEVPACATSGFGNATVTFDSARQNINVTITVAGLGSSVTSAEIRQAAAGANGTSVLAFTPTASFTSGKLTGTFPISSDLATQILQNPGNFYLNISNSGCSAGAVRGQLGFVTGGVITYAAELRGQNEVPPNSSSAFGSAFVTFDFANNAIAWDVNSSGIVSATLSHIHRGSTTVSGPVIINFATAAAQIPNGHSKGSDTLTGARVTSNFQPATDVPALSSAATAFGYYVNLHSTAFGGGEIRGPLLPANEYDIPVAGRVTNGQGQTFVTDVRIFNPSYDGPTVALIEYFAASTTANATATASMVANLPARGTAILDDIAGASGLNSIGTVGALRVTSVAQLAVTSRIYADLRSTGRGTFGQFVPAVSRANGLRRGVMPQLSNRNDLTTGFRTNVGFFNPNSGTATVRLELRDGSGTLLGQNTISLAGLSQQQTSIANYFPGVDLSNAQNLTLSFDSNELIDGYASVVDNVSADQIFVPAQSDSGVATAP